MYAVTQQISIFHPRLPAPKNLPAASIQDLIMEGLRIFLLPAVENSTLPCVRPLTDYTLFSRIKLYDG